MEKAYYVMKTKKSEDNVILQAKTTRLEKMTGRKKKC